MTNMRELPEDEFDETGGETLDGSGFKDEIPDPTVDVTDDELDRFARGSQKNAKEYRDVE